MKLALLGHGQMARVVEAQARAAGHDLGAVITSRNAADAVRLLPGHTVAIDFSVPAAVKEHVTAAVTAGVPLVQGTTGWQRDEHDVRRIVEQGGGAGDPPLRGRTWAHTGVRGLRRDQDRRDRPPQPGCSGRGGRPR